jgi:Family of unknown function (DUF5990)
MELPMRIVLVAPPAGVDYGVQHGKGNDYTTILLQRSAGGDLVFEFTITVKDQVADESPNFLGPLSQGPVAGRFVYIDIGTAAGQADSEWTRRIKIPLAGITWEMIGQATAKPKIVIEARFPGTAKDGGPSCATLRPIDGWMIRKR